MKSNSRSQSLFEKAKQFIPGGVNSPVRAFRAVGGNPVFMKKGKGAFLFDEDGNQLAQGETGEICARGPQVMRGYWQKDNEGVFFAKEWFRTGDIGLMDTEGFFKIVDRKKDMILLPHYPHPPLLDSSNPPSQSGREGGRVGRNA